MSTTPNPSTLNWFEVPTTDLERARTFYESILNTSLRREATDPADLMYVFPVERSPGQPAVTGALVQRELHQPGTEGTIIYLNCNGKLQQVIDRVPSAGGTITMPVTPVPGGFGQFACIRDTEGNILGLHST